MVETPCRRGALSPFGDIWGRDHAEEGVNHILDGACGPVLGLHVEDPRVDQFLAIMAYPGAGGCSAWGWDQQHGDEHRGPQPNSSQQQPPNVTPNLQACQSID